jgi:hypothetical protein
VKPLVLFLAIATSAYAQSDLHHSFTFSAGAAVPVQTNCCQNDTVASLGLTYGYRVLPFLQLEAGFTTAANAAPEFRGANYDIQPNDRYVWVPFGIRGIVPVRERVELSVAGGGLYERYTVDRSGAGFGLVDRRGWGWQAGAGAAVALDRRRHFWLGGSPRFFFANTNRGYSHDRWFVLSGDIAFRF